MQGTDVLVLLRVWNAELERNASWLTQPQGAPAVPKSEGESVAAAHAKYGCREPGVHGVQRLSEGCGTRPAECPRRTWRNECGALGGGGLGSALTTAITEQNEPSESVVFQQINSQRQSEGLARVKADSGTRTRPGKAATVAAATSGRRTPRAETERLTAYQELKTESYTSQSATRVPLSRQILSALRSHVKAIPMSDVHRSHRMRFLRLSRVPPCPLNCKTEDLPWNMGIERAFCRTESGLVMPPVEPRDREALGSPEQRWNSSESYPPLTDRTVRDPQVQERSSSVADARRRVVPPRADSAAESPEGLCGHSAPLLADDSKPSRREIAPESSHFQRERIDFIHDDNGAHGVDGACVGGCLGLERARGHVTVTGREHPGIAPRPIPGENNPCKRRRMADDLAQSKCHRLGDMLGNRYLFMDAMDAELPRYILLLPLLARVLAVSCPGLHCVVQFPLKWQLDLAMMQRSWSVGEGNAGDRSGTITSQIEGDNRHRACVPKSCTPGIWRAPSQHARARGAAAPTCSARRSAVPQPNDSERSPDTASFQEALMNALLLRGWQLLVLPASDSESPQADTATLSLAQVHPHSWRVSSLQDGQLLSGWRRNDGAPCEPPSRLPSSVWRRVQKLRTRIGGFGAEVSAPDAGWSYASHSKHTGILSCDNVAQHVRPSCADDLRFYVAYDNGSSVELVTCADPVLYGVRKSRVNGCQPVLVFCFNQHHASIELADLVLPLTESVYAHAPACVPRATRLPSQPRRLPSKGMCSHENVLVVDIGAQPVDMRMAFDAHRESTASTKSSANSTPSEALITENPDTDTERKMETAADRQSPCFNGDIPSRGGPDLLDPARRAQSADHGPLLAADERLDHAHMERVHIDGNPNEDVSAVASGQESRPVQPRSDHHRSSTQEHDASLQRTSMDSQRAVPQAPDVHRAQRSTETRFEQSTGCVYKPSLGQALNDTFTTCRMRRT